MKSVLLTGTTGFLGSSLAAQLLALGIPVLSLSRSDPDGARTRAAVTRAAKGFGFLLTEEQLARLRVIECGFRELERELPASELAAVTEAWHCAAHMSYSLKRVEEALQQNLRASVELYQLLAERAPLCERFYHVSTAYTAGIEGGLVREELHPRPKLINAYQLSKWCAEQSLANLSQRHELPVTIFRPTIVVGHSRTGWSSGNSFGFFMFADALRLARRMGARAVQVDIRPDGRPNVIPIDEVVGAMVGLSLRQGRIRARQLEVFNCAHTHRLSTAEHLAIIAEGAGIRATCGKPRTPFDEEINRGVSWNREFASADWDFDSSALRAELERAGTAFCREALDRESLLRMVRAFVTEADAREKPSRRRMLLRLPLEQLMAGLRFRAPWPRKHSSGRRKSVREKA